MIAVSEQRCPHLIMRSIVRCEPCDRRDAARAKALPSPLQVVDSPYLDMTQQQDKRAPIIVAVEPSQPMSFAFSVAAPGVPVWPLRERLPHIPIPSASPSSGIDPWDVLDAVTETFFVSRGALLGKLRLQSIAHARLTAYWLLRRLCFLSYPQIGHLIGSRDHTTVMHGVTRVERLRASDIQYRERLDGLVRRLGTVTA